MKIALVSMKGGVTKTTTAVHLAAGLAEEGRTLLVDADPHCSALSWSEKVGEGFPCPVIALPVKDLHRRLPDLAAGYSHVVIDTPPNDTAVSRSAVMAVSSQRDLDEPGVVIVPLAPSTMDVDRLRETLELIADVEASHPVDLRVLIVRARARTRLSEDVRTVLDELGAPLMTAVVPLREAYAGAFGAPPAPQVDYAAVLDELRS